MMSLDELNNYGEYIALLRDRSTHIQQGNTYCVDYISQSIVSTLPQATFGVQCKTLPQAKIVQLTRLLIRSDRLKPNVVFGLKEELKTLSAQYPEYAL